MTFEELITIHKDKSISIQIKREMQTMQGKIEVAWQDKSIAVSKLTVSSIRKLLGQIKIGAIKTNTDGETLLQTLLSSAPVKAILTKEEIAWAIEHGLIVRFHNNPSRLRDEVEQQGLSGHKTALYDEDYLKRKSVQEETDPELTFQEILTQTAVSSITHVNDKATDTAFVLSESHPEEQEEELITAKDSPSWLADTTHITPENEQVVIHPVDTRSYDGFHDAVVDMVDHMILYIKTQAGSDTSAIPSIREQHIEVLDKEWRPKKKKIQLDEDDQKEALIDRTVVETKGVFNRLNNGYWYEKADLEKLEYPHTYKEDEQLFYCKGDDFGYDENGEVDFC